MNVQITSQSGVGKTVNVYLTYLLVFGDKPVYLNLSMYVLYIHMHICTHFEIMSVAIIYYTLMATLVVWLACVRAKVVKGFDQQ